MDNLPHPKISELDMQDVISVPKGSKPPVIDYMSDSDIAQHLELFDGDPRILEELLGLDPQLLRK